MKILGISSYYHDSAAALLIDGVVVAAAQEERFSRIKHDNSFPTNACEFCLNKAGITISDIDKIVFYEKPFLKFERILETNIIYAPRTLRTFLKSMPIWLKERLNLKSLIKKEVNKLGLFNGEITFTEHHLSHAAFAYYTSGFDDAVILTVDAVGEWTTTSVMLASKNCIKILKEQHFPHSIGMLYSAFTQYLGFKVNSDEYKVMGLAPYGKSDDTITQRYISLIENNMLKMNDDGSIQLNMKYFSYTHSFSMINEYEWNALFGLKKREAKENITDEHISLAFAIQYVLENIIKQIALQHRQYSENLCISGGTALNCSANGMLLDSSIYRNIYVPCSPGDSGGAIGACLAEYFCDTDHENVHDNSSPYLGPEFSSDTISAALAKENLSYECIYDTNELCRKTATLLSHGNIIGWFQGRMEFGPRALGNRSILADPRVGNMKDKINKIIKFREAFRPFAPAVTSEHCAEYFTITQESPYMMFTCDVKNDQLPAITHVDNSARVQTVSYNSNPLFHKLLSSFNEVASCPVLLNTSYNVMGEPIVCTPEDAINTFLKSGLDYLVIGNYIVAK